MHEFIAFLFGGVAGGIAMFLIQRNNIKWFAKREAQIKALPEQAKKILRAYNIDV
jgi:hypothetical protein